MSVNTDRMSVYGSVGNEMTFRVRQAGQSYMCVIPKLAMLTLSGHYEPLNNN